MTDDDIPPGGAAFVMEQRCEHPATHPDCPGTDTIPCLAHFAELAQHMLRVAPHHTALLAVANHVIEHGWMNQMMMTWTALWTRFVSTRDDPHEAAAALTTYTFDHDGGDLQQRNGLPFLNTLRIVGALGLSNDGPGVVDALDVAWNMPDAERVAFLSALLMSARFAVETSSEATGRLVHLYYLFGGAVLRPVELSVIHHLVAATDALTDLDLDTADGPLRKLALGYDVEGRSAALTLAVQALARFLVDIREPEHLTSVDANGIPTAIVKDWRDEALDGTLPDGVLRPVWALRCAQAVLDGAPDRMADYVGRQPHPTAWLFGTTSGALVLVARQVRVLEEMRAAQGAGVGPPAGHPG